MYIKKKKEKKESKTLEYLRKKREEEYLKNINKKKHIMGYKCNPLDRGK